MKRKRDEKTVETERMESHVETENSDASIDSENTSYDGKPDENGNFDEYFEHTAKDEYSEHAAKDGSADKSEVEAIDVEAILQEYAPQPKRKRKKKEDAPPPVEPIISGELFIEMIDAGAVSIIGIADNYLSKNPIDAQLVSLRQEQKDKLKLLADRAVIELQKKIEVNPLTAFGVAIGSMYLMNYVMIRALMNANKKSQV
jgi:hypothetical protein